MSSSARSNLAKSLGLALIAGALLEACVFTTHEGVGEPPQAAPRPPPPGPKGASPPRRTPQSEESAPAPLRLSHLVVQYQGARGAPPEITRDRKAARERAHEALERARKGEDFGQLVAEYSDEAGAAQRKGDLGLVQKNAVVPEFADAAFELGPGEISEVVETPFGFHVIRRAE